MWELNYKENWMQRIDVFELWRWRRLLRVSWTARRSNQSILKEISPGYSLEGLMLKLKLQNFVATWCKELTHLKRSFGWQRLKAGGVGDNRGWNSWMASLTQWTREWNNWMTSLTHWTGSLACSVHGVAKSRTWLSLTECSIVYIYHNFFILSSVSGHIGCFHVLAIVYSAKMNNCIHVSLSILVSSGYMPSSGTAESYGGFISNF